MTEEQSHFTDFVETDAMSNRVYGFFALIQGVAKDGTRVDESNWGALINSALPAAHECAAIFKRVSG